MDVTGSIGYRARVLACENEVGCRNDMIAQRYPYQNRGTAPSPGYRSFGARRNLPATRAAHLSFTDQFDAVSIFICAAAFALSVMIAAIGVVLHKSSGLSVRNGQRAEFDFSVAVDGPRTKDQFLARVNSAEQREMAATVHYVSEIISRKSVRLPRADAYRLARHIVLESKRQDFDPLFVAAVIKSESLFNKTAVSHVGALGLMQILPDTGRYISGKNNIDWLGAVKLKDPSYNIRLGIAYLKYLEQYFGKNREHILVAYNWGPGNLLQALKKRSPLPAGPMKYARTIIGDHGKWHREYSERAEEFQFLDTTMLLG